ncbi:MAG: hypothetical protein H7Y15_19255, partial [Pseudonocardia sp.]|nr:hypothetical protein [Pseudonocardia sp.]
MTLLALFTGSVVGVAVVEDAAHEASQLGPRDQPSRAEGRGGQSGGDPAVSEWAAPSSGGRGSADRETPTAAVLPPDALVPFGMSAGELTPPVQQLPPEATAGILANFGIPQPGRSTGPPLPAAQPHYGAPVVAAEAVLALQEFVHHLNRPLPEPEIRAVDPGAAVGVGAPPNEVGVQTADPFRPVAAGPDTGDARIAVASESTFEDPPLFKAVANRLRAPTVLPAEDEPSVPVLGFGLPGFAVSEAEQPQTGGKHRATPDQVSSAASTPALVGTGEIERQVPKVSDDNARDRARSTAKTAATSIAAADEPAAVADIAAADGTVADTRDRAPSTAAKTIADGIAAADETVADTRDRAPSTAARTVADGIAAADETVAVADNAAEGEAAAADARGHVPNPAKAAADIATVDRTATAAGTATADGA